MAMGGWALAELDWDLGELQRPPIEDLLEAMSFFIYNVKINKRALGRLQESSYRGFIGSNVFLCLNVKINRRALGRLQESTYTGLELVCTRHLTHFPWFVLVCPLG